MRKLKVLYIDDEANTEKFASKIDILRYEGIDVESVYLLQEVLEKIRQLKNEIDLIILDIIMPPEYYYTLEETNGGTSTGIRLLQDIRSEFPTIPIMIVSIRRREIDDKIIKKYNVVKYLEKPITALHIVSAIKDIFEKG